MCWVGWFRSKTCVALCPIKTGFLGFLKILLFWLFTRWRDYMDERYHKLLSMLTKILFLSNSAISLKILHSYLLFAIIFGSIYWAFSIYYVASACTQCFISDFFYSSQWIMTVLNSYFMIDETKNLNNLSKVIYYLISGRVSILT